MSNQAWLALCGGIAFLAFMAGFLGRAMTTNDQYLRAQTAQYVATQRYFDAKFDDTINYNQKGIKK